METINIRPNEVRKTFWHVTAGLCLMILLWRLPDILGVLLK